MIGKKGFTMTEVMIVILILSVLGVIEFISFQGYSKTTRDTKRVVDVDHMKKTLAIAFVGFGRYPVPDKSESITYKGEVLWYQGTFGDNVVSQLSKNLKKKPVDPLLETEYIYSVSQSRKQ